MKLEQRVQGKEYWRSLDQLADTPEFKEFLHREFPENASEMTNPFTRRKFLTLMGASIAFAGLAGCRRPVEKIIPYVNAPEHIIPGKSLNYATTMPLGLNSYGLLVESHVGRPTKIEGNPKHPSSLGKSNRLIQAEILNLYDPDRSKSVMHKGVPATWEAFESFWADQAKGFEQKGGEGLVVFSRAFHAPTLFRLYEAFLKKYPKAKWVAYESVSDANIYKGLDIAFGKPLQPVYAYDKAAVVLSLGSDFLLTETDDIRATKGFAAGRKVDEHGKMNRLYVVENAYTTTGAMADHRLRMQSGEIAAFAFALLAELKKQGLAVNELPLPAGNNKVDKKWVTTVAKDLRKNKGRALVVAGKEQPAVVHAVCSIINEVLEANGNTVRYLDMKNALLPDTEELSKVVQALKNKKVKTLVMLEVNPVYDAPLDYGFEEVIKNAAQTIHFGMHADETAVLCEWHIPAAHFLESWGDACSVEGTPSVVQPLIEPLFDGVPTVQMAAVLSGEVKKSAYELVRNTWQKKLVAGSFEREWRKVLTAGLYKKESYKTVKLRLKSERVVSYLKQDPVKIQHASLNNLEVVFTASPATLDGRYANNGWLQEMPHPVSRLAWDNPLFVSPNTAKELGVANGELAVLTVNGTRIKLPVWVLPGHADHSVTATLGYGRTASGRVGNGVGFNVSALRISTAPDFVTGGRLSATGETYLLANTQDHGSMEGRPLVREATLEEFHQEPHFAEEMVEHPPLKSLWEEPRYDEGYQWGMTIDLNSCTGCNACMVACQSENNIPVVGKEQVSKGREMHWIRLDRYFSGDLRDPEMVFQPVACQHCENAPCEQVCPVAATSHDEEGLNVMTYNRCIGTRYCSNNCPYKVRRFNFFNYTNELPEIVKMAQNPDVSIRFRGVMEKCTFCTQRITRSKIHAKNQGRELRDGEVQAACQQTCPADAITFGNILDKESAVAKSKLSPRNYELLGELNLKTRNTFLAKIRNPNPELVGYQPAS